jgi:hypothetical protein
LRNTRFTRSTSLIIPEHWALPTKPHTCLPFALCQFLRL